MNLLLWYQISSNPKNSATDAVAGGGTPLPLRRKTPLIALEFFLWTSTAPAVGKSAASGAFVDERDRVPFRPGSGHHSRTDRARFRAAAELIGELRPAR
jgi:hypothetical protein